MRKVKFNKPKEYIYESHKDVKKVVDELEDLFDNTNPINNWLIKNNSNLRIVLVDISIMILQIKYLLEQCLKNNNIIEIKELLELAKKVLEKVWNLPENLDTWLIENNYDLWIIFDNMCSDICQVQNLLEKYIEIVNIGE